MRILNCLVLSVALVACALDQPPSVEGGYDPSLDDCCLWFVAPWEYERPQACLEDHTDVGALDHGQCRWLQCLGGLTTYSVCNP